MSTSFPSYAGPTGQGPQPPNVPEEAGENRLALAAVTDGLLALIIGFALSQRVFHAHDNVGQFLATLVGCLLAVSFVNHVVGTLLFRGSLAKWLFGMRVVRAKNGQRAGFWRTLLRWLVGFVVIIGQYFLEGESVGQACGLRTIRRRDERLLAAALRTR
ncbi:RDD family protein [Nocardia donostiensis]|uniref:RDD family protein n=1 Tax=Nocardia donostiensis TaxID=1538463 RepID=UPI00158A5215|nr:RDD family protein [Nocardia donostiensis]